MDTMRVPGITERQGGHVGRTLGNVQLGVLRRMCTLWPSGSLQRILALATPRLDSGAVCWDRQDRRLSPPKADQPPTRDAQLAPSSSPPNAMTDSDICCFARLVMVMGESSALRDDAPRGRTRSLGPQVPARWAIGGFRGQIAIRRPSPVGGRTASVGLEELIVGVGARRLRR
ncbi:hypothetical protein BD309DRAFT_954837 [Dichomitus squalens]|nr:hypothetical protein BD309DRAFT_954837 [Dichomitus squalens]